MNQRDIEGVFKHGFNHLLMLSQGGDISADEAIDRFEHQLVVEINDAVQVTRQHFLGIFLADGFDARSIGLRKRNDHAAVCQNRVDLLEIVCGKKHGAVFQPDKRRLKVIIENVGVGFIRNGKQFVVDTGTIAIMGNLIDLVENVGDKQRVRAEPCFCDTPDVRRQIGSAVSCHSVAAIGLGNLDDFRGDLKRLFHQHAYGGRFAAAFFADKPQAFHQSTPELR